MICAVWLIMRSLWRDQTRIVTFLLLMIFIVLYVFSDDSSTLNSLDTLSIDLESEGNVRFKTGRSRKNNQGEEHKNDVITENVDKSREDKPRVSLDNFVDWEMKELLKKPTVPEPKYLDCFKTIFNPIIQKPQEIVHKEGFIEVGFTLINLQRTDKFGHRFTYKVERTFSTLMTYSSDTPIHLIMVTDPASLKSLGTFLLHFISRSLSEGVIFNGGRGKIRLPKLRFSFVDVEDIKKLDEPFVNALKRNTEAKDGEKIDKYSADLFYIAPLFYKSFSNLDRMIFLDATDLDFFDSIKHLQKQFDNIDKEWMGVGVETTPHYRKNLAKYLEDHYGSPLGLPGPQQGLNTGVVLFNFKSMRESGAYQEHLRPDRVDLLIRKYGYKMNLGDQDWFTNLAWDHPEKFFILPCHYNAQTNIQLLTPPWEDVFDSYHYCDVKTKLKIVHRNGCGPIPQMCGNTPDPKSEYWRNKKNFYVDMHVNIEGLWEIMADVHRGDTDFHMFKYL